MKRIYSRVSDDEFVEIKKAVLDKGVTIEQAVKRGLDLYLFNETSTISKEKENVRNESECRAPEDQEAVQGD